MMIDKLITKPCPFCGLDAVIEKCGSQYLPMCSDENCIAGDNGANRREKADAVELWNRRAGKATEAQQPDKGEYGHWVDRLAIRHGDNVEILVTYFEKIFKAYANADEDGLNDAIHLASDYVDEIAGATR